MTKLPDKLFGREVKGSLERVLAEKESKPQTTRSVTPINVPNVNEYIYVPSTKLYVAKERTHLGKYWNKVRDSLEQENSFMMNMYEFVEFLKFLRENPTKENSLIYEDITAVRDPYRSELIDVKFSKENGKMFVDYYKLINGNRELIHEPLIDHLDKDRKPGMDLLGIDLNEWISNHTTQGFPRNDILKGSTYYFAPRDGRVAWFGVYWGWSGLVCDGDYLEDPSYSYSSRGVRAAKLKV